MNIEYLDTLPEVPNKYGFDLLDGEKAVFVTEIEIFGDDKDKHLGTDCKFTLTNKRILINNGPGIWSNDIAEEIASCVKVADKFIFKKWYYFAVTLNKEEDYDYGRQKLSGFHYYFKNSDIAKFEEIMNYLFE